MPKTKTSKKRRPKGPPAIDRVAQRIIDLMAEGNLPPWSRPWSGGVKPFPVNAEGAAYRGINVFVLDMIADVEGFDDPRWVTFRKVQQLGGHIRRGQRGARIVFWKLLQSPDDDSYEPPPRRIISGSYTVFNWQQCGGLFHIPPPALPLPPDDPSSAAEELVTPYLSSQGPELRFTDSRDRVSYSSANDRIVIPSPGRFDSIGDYYSTLFHEVAHSTGHATRLDRSNFSENIFSSHDYGVEELVAEMAASLLRRHAEMAASLLRRHAGINVDPIENASASYMSDWLRTISEDRSMVWTAAQRAQSAVDHVLRFRDTAEADIEAPEAAVA